MAPLGGLPKPRVEFHGTGDRVAKVLPRWGLNGPQLAKMAFRLSDDSQGSLVDDVDFLRLEIER